METLFTIFKWFLIASFTTSFAYIALFEIRHRRSLAYAKVSANRRRHRPF